MKKIKKCLYVIGIFLLLCLILWILAVSHNVLHIHIMCDMLMFPDHITFDGEKYYPGEIPFYMGLNVAGTVDIEAKCKDGHILQKGKTEAWYYKEDTDYTFLSFNSLTWTKDPKYQKSGQNQ